MDTLIRVLLSAGWVALVLPWEWGTVAAIAVVASCLGVVCIRNRPKGDFLAMATTVSASIAVALVHHTGFLILAWIASGGALALLVRREGGETSGKPGRVLDVQQHAASVLLFVLLTALVAAHGRWELSMLQSSMAAGRIHQMLAEAGVRHGDRVWEGFMAGMVAATVALRLGLFPFPFSLRRSARRLHGLPLLTLLVVFLPTSMVALARLNFALHDSGGVLLPASTAVLGCVALVTGALWLQVEWLAESVLGQVAQCYMGLALLSLGFHDMALVTRVVMQGALALIAGGVWTMRMRALLQTSDLAKAGEGYRDYRELTASHAVFVVLASPLPGTPGGQVWIGILGQNVASGSGFGLVVLLGIVLAYCALFRSLAKVSPRLRRDHTGCTLAP